jgi:orotate phosphoribosyltransferase
MTYRDQDVRQRARKALEASEVLINGHFDYGNGYHGRVYLNPHALFLEPSTIWRVAQDLLDLLPYDITSATDLVAGPATGGALLAHTLAGLLDGRRSLTHPPCRFAPFNNYPQDGLVLRAFYARHMAGQRVLLADDVRNTGKTLARCADLVRAAGGTVIATAQIYDRLEAVVDLGVPNVALVDYGAPQNMPADDCPLCRSEEPVTRF